MHASLPQEGRYAQHAKHGETKRRDDDPADLLQERKRATQRGAHRSRGGTQRDEHEREAQYEEHRMQRGATPGRVPPARR